MKRKDSCLIRKRGGGELRRGEREELRIYREKVREN
jgi:hypothetical protein